MPTISPLIEHRIVFNKRQPSLMKWKETSAQEREKKKKPLQGSKVLITNNKCNDKNKVENK